IAATLSARCLPSAMLSSPSDARSERLQELDDRVLVRGGQLRAVGASLVAGVRVAGPLRVVQEETAALLFRHVRHEADLHAIADGVAAVERGRAVLTRHPPD